MHACPNARYTHIQRSVKFTGFFSSLVLCLDSQCHGASAGWSMSGNHAFLLRSAWWTPLQGTAYWCVLMRTSDPDKT